MSDKIDGIGFLTGQFQGVHFYLVGKVGGHHEKDSREHDARDDGRMEFHGDNPFRVVFHATGFPRRFEPVRFLDHMSFPSGFSSRGSVPGPGGPGRAGNHLLH